MSKNKITGLNDWSLTKNIPKNKRKVEVRIHFKYPNIKTLLHLSPKERMVYIDKKHKEYLKKIIDLCYFDKYVIIGNEKRPTGVTVTVPFSKLVHFEKLTYVHFISIQKIEGGNKIPTKPITNLEYYCVKMTVAIEVEGAKKGFQTYDERFVLIKAKSFDDAYTKIEKTKDKYSGPYLNTAGQLMRWRVESLDDCYQTDIIKYNELEDSDPIEVFSTLKKRKLTKDRIWDGSFKK